MARLLRGKEVADAVCGRLLIRTEALRAKGVVPKLAIVRCGEKTSDLAYERGAVKRAADTGVETEIVVLPADVDRETLVGELRRLNGDPGVHGVLLFRPIPKHLRIYDKEIFNSIDPSKDVDCMTDLSSAGVYMGREIGFPPCTPDACMKILEHYGVDLTGKNVTVIGRSLVVGKPVAMMLLAKHATVTICHTRTREIEEITKRADIIITAANDLGTLTGRHVRPGQVVIDVSICWDPAKNDGRGGISGDAVMDEIEPVVEAVTPVPGGVGSVTTSILMEHVVRAAEAASEQKNVGC